MVRKGPSLAKDLVGGEETALDPDALGKLGLDVTAELRGGVLDRCRVASHEGGREGGALPEVVMPGLRHGGPEPPLELRLQPGDLLALALEASVVGEVEVDLDQADEAHSSSRS